MTDAKLCSSLHSKGSSHSTYIRPDSKLLAPGVYFAEADETKGPLISKCLFSVFVSHIKQTKKFDFTTMVSQIKLSLFVFCGELKTPKIHFEIN